jgi:hypothetical protein
MSDTPRTDEARMHNLWDLSEQLERELNAMTAERDAGNAALANVARLMDSVSKAEAEVEKLREVAGKALAYMESVGRMDMYPDEWAIVEALRAALKETK